MDHLPVHTPTSSLSHRGCNWPIGDVAILFPGLSLDNLVSTALVYLVMTFPEQSIIIRLHHSSHPQNVAHHDGQSSRRLLLL